MGYDRISLDCPSWERGEYLCVYDLHGDRDILTALFFLCASSYMDSGCDSDLAPTTYSASAFRLWSPKVLCIFRMCFSVWQDMLFSEQKKKDALQSSFTDPHRHRCSFFLLPHCTLNMWKATVSSWSSLLKTEICLSVDPLHIQAPKSTTHKVLVTASSCFPMWSPQWPKEEQKESWPLLSYTSKSTSTPPFAFVWPSDLALVFWKVGLQFF